MNPHEPHGKCLDGDGMGWGFRNMEDNSMANPENKDSLLFSQKGMLHCGAEIVSERAVRKMETPDPEGRWHPVPHIQVSDCAREHLAVGGYEVKQQEHSLSRNGERWFSLMELGTTKEHGGDELSRIVGLRNSHDKSFRAQVVTGTGVFVCDNLAFNGQINVGRKHTTHILRDMPILMGKCVSKLASVWEDSERRIEVYKERPLSREEVHDLLCLGLDLWIRCKNVPWECTEYWTLTAGWILSPW